MSSGFGSGRLLAQEPPDELAIYWWRDTETGPLIVDFILLLIEGVLTFIEHLFHHGRPLRRGKVRKSLERRKVQRSE